MNVQLVKFSKKKYFSQHFFKPSVVNNYQSYERFFFVKKTIQHDENSQRKSNFRQFFSGKSWSMPKNELSKLVKIYIRFQAYLCKAIFSILLNQNPLETRGETQFLKHSDIFSILKAQSTVKAVQIKIDSFSELFQTTLE